MIEAINENIQTLTSNSDIVTFNDVDLRTQSANCQNGWLNYNEGSAQFNIVAGGIYEIDFGANITSASTGSVALAIYQNGTKINGTEMDENISTANNWRNISRSKRIRVCGRGVLTITIQSVPSVNIAGTPTATQIPSIKNANIILRRIGN